MNKLILGISLSATLFLVNAYAESANGKNIFEAKGCVVCHKKDMDTIGPSLKTIATAYTGKEKSLLTYLQGSGTAIVDPARAAVMNPQLVKTKILPEEDLRDLAMHIITVNDSKW